MVKKHWKKNEAAVSPVIATILMVAITVVLAAVLYVMVIGMSDNPGETAPTGTIHKQQVSVNSTSGYDVIISITTLSRMTSISALDYKIGSGTTTDVTTIVSFVAGSCTFTDVSNDQQASNGDYFTIRGQVLTTAGVTFYLIYEPTGDVIDTVLITP